MNYVWRAVSNPLGLKSIKQFVDRRVSIIMPLYNSAKYIDETIESVTQQTYLDWELIVVDDCSTDDSAERVKKWTEQDERIRIIKLARNSGPAVARNMALENASGRIIAFLDSDDLWHPKKLEIQLKYMCARNAAFCFSSYQRLNEDGTQTGRQIKVPSEVTYRQLLKQNVIATLTTIIDRSKTGDFRMLDQGYDDYILWLTLLKKVGVAHGIQESLADYRIVGGSLSRNKLRSAQWIWYIYQHVEKLSFVSSCYYLFCNSLRVGMKHMRF